MADKKLKKVIDKFFCWVYYPTRKGKGVFENKFSEASFTFYKKIQFDSEGKGVFLVQVSVPWKATLPFVFQIHDSRE